MSAFGRPEWFVAGLLAGMVVSPIWIGARDEWRRVHQPAASTPTSPTPTADPYGYFAVPTPPATPEPCGRLITVAGYNDPGQGAPLDLFVTGDGQQCLVALVTHQRLVGMAAVDRWEWASADVPTRPVLGQPSIGPSQGVVVSAVEAAHP